MAQLTLPKITCLSQARSQAVQHISRQRCSYHDRLQQHCKVQTQAFDDSSSSYPLSITSSPSSFILRQPKATGNALSDLLAKLKLCFNIFFPERPKDVSPKEEVKRRLKMVLVADRCGMSPGSISELKKTIAKALQDFVDIESEEAIEVNISTDPGLGTVYCVAIPVRRVRAEARYANDKPEVIDGVSLEWDPADWNSDPTSRFPMGC